MERHFDEELGKLKHLLIKMSALAETMIAESIKLLVKRDQSALPLVNQHEKEVNHLQVEIDEMCLKLIALHQPAASDLRFIIGATKTNSELERLADQAVNICNKAERLNEEPPLRECVIIPEMADIARNMIRESLHAYVNKDVGKARAVLLEDDKLDDLKVKITTELVDFMIKDPTTIRRALDMALVARNLERIGDHATNIAENAIFVVEGRDIRHHAGETSQQA